MKAKKNEKILNYIVGTIVVILVIIGIASIVIFSLGKIKDGRNATELAKREQYEELVAPVIMNDPDTFDDVTKADANALVAITIWSILEDNSDPDKYDYIEGGMLLPQKEVEEKFKKLFGPDVTLNHSTVDGGGIEFKYSEKKSCYIIPITGITPIYTPRVTDIDKKGNSVVLTVGYLAGEDWVQDSNGNMVAPEPAKYVRVTLRKNTEGELYVAAIQNADNAQSK